MNYKEIIEKLQSLGISVDNFAYDDVDVKIPEDFVFSSEGLETERRKNEARDKLLAHPGHSNGKLRDAEYSELAATYNEISYNYSWKKNEYLKSLDLEWKEVEQVGGEDQGSTWYSIKHFPQHDVYIKVSGYYTSYNGTDFDGGWSDCSEIKPVQKTVTVFE